ncbi:MAG: thioredoxin fold domain-containing protein [Hydrogenophaga sp.]|jgi:thiol:disulfide interchange protein DsbG|nr:thioredoxin fold domain-containing protein [Hydrogenophaga sp.]
MHTRTLALTLATALTLLLGACSKEPATAPEPSAAQPIAAGQAYDAVASGSKGFTVGPMMSANAVYVLFDPQCPHCGRLWQATLPLLPKVKFVWVPVAIMGPKSVPQGAALLQATDPVATMSAHESALLQGQGGMSASASVPDEIFQAIKANSLLLDRLGADSVPFIVARHAGTGQPLTHSGALGTEDLMALLGLAKP